MAGVTLGTVASFAGSRVLTGLLYGVQPTDAVTFAVVPVLLLLVAMLATFMPARRAMHTDPVAAIRNE